MAISSSKTGKTTPAASDSTQTAYFEKDDIRATSPEESNSRSRRSSPQMIGTMIVPADHPEIELKHEVYGPDDARSFSPRRGMEDTEKMVGGKRSLLKSHADELQNGLNAIVEKVESVKSDHDKLERNNSALQDYIGGLTQSMSRTNLAVGGQGGSGGRKK